MTNTWPNLPDDRRTAIEEVRAVILANLPDGYQESMNWGMISYEIPLERYPDTYNKKPSGLRGPGLAEEPYGGLSDEYLLVRRLRRFFEAQYRATGKRYDVGKSCVRFRKIDDLPLDLIGRTIAATSVDQYIARYEAARASS